MPLKALSNRKECPNCGDDHKSRPFCIYDNGEHCFSCGYTKTRDRLPKYVDKKELSTDVVNFPSNATRDPAKFSIEALMWLAEYNISSTEIYEHGILFCGDDNSLVFVNKDKDGMIVGWQKRQMKSRYITGTGTKTPTLLSSVNNTNTLVIVEDYISALRVSYTHDSLCLWGTKLNYAKMIECFDNYDTLVLWLDNDADKDINSGQEAAKVILDAAKYCVMRWDSKRLYNPKKMYNVVSDKDPKYYLDLEIKHIIGVALNDRRQADCVVKSRALRFEG